MKRYFFLLGIVTGVGVFPSFSQVKVLCTPPAVLPSADVTICSGQIASISVTHSATTAPYTYQWSPSGDVACPTCSNTTATPTTTTTYTMVVTDGQPCTASGVMVTVTVLSTPTVSVSGTATICTGTGTTLTASGSAATYSWSPGGSTSTSVSVSPTTGTNYTVVATGANTCTNTATYSVTVNSTPTVSVSGNATVCNGTPTTLTASGSAATYSWSPGGATATSISVTPSSGTNYTVVATAPNTCTGSATYSVTVNPLPTATITGTTTICNGQFTTLTAGGGITYSWNTGATTTAILDNPSSTTFYTVQATDANGCTDLHTQGVTVNPLPTANAGPDVSICSGSNTTLNATGNGSFSWSPSTGLSSTTLANPTANPSATTSYTVTVTNSCGSTSDSVRITINALPSVNAGTDATICQGGNTTLIASGSGTYSWSPSAGLSNSSIANPVANPTTTTDYTVTVTDVCGTASDVVQVVVDIPMATVSGPASICFGSSATLIGAGGVTYSWSTGQTSSSIVVSPTTAAGYTVSIVDAFGCTDNDNMTVNINALPTPGISGNTTICEGSSTTLTATGGSGYSWSTGSTANPIVVSPTTSTTYSVDVTDGNGCSAGTSVLVTVNPLPVANAGPDVTICAGNSTTLNATGNGAYNWNPTTGLSNPSISNPVATPTGTTNYTVSVSNICGTADDEVIVTVNLLPVISVSGNDTVCSGAADTLVATGGGMYLWNTGSTNDTLMVNPTSTTVYTVTVTGLNGCSASSSYTVNASTVTASVSGTSPICSGQNATLTASGGIAYQWNTGSSATTILVSPSVTTTYTVTAFNAMGCTGTATFSVSVTPQPTASITATSSTICSGSSSTLTASGGTTYVWSPTTGLSNTTIANPIANPTSAVTYTVIVSNGTCADTASIAIGVNPVPTATLSVSAATICVGDSAVLTASGGILYLWSPGGQTTSAISASPSSATNYTVTVTDANGCTDNAATLINVVPQINITISSNTTICAGSQTTLTAQGGGPYTWSPGGQSTSAIVVSPGTATNYTVVANNGACSDTATVSVAVNPVPSVTASASPYSINVGNSSTLTGSSSTGTYNWYPSTGLSCTQCPNPVASPTATTTYTLVTTDSAGCSALDTVIVNVSLECEEIFIPNAFSPNDDTHNDFFRVRNPLPCIKTLHIVIFNRWGQKVFETEEIDGKWDGTVNGKKADPAVFFYIINIELVTDKYLNFQGNVSLIR